MGGVAGGDKYVVRGIIFKFANDRYNIYGSEENAQKAAGHDLNGLMCYRNTKVEGLHFPLMAVNHDINI